MQAKFSKIEIKLTAIALVQVPDNINLTFHSFCEVNREALTEPSVV